uniref:Ycf55 n=1 Tax=Anunuuluaehu liula TaxID=3049639 RepID=UPI0030034F31
MKCIQCRRYNMIKYWPREQGIDLNSEVAHLFFNTRQKFSYNLLNRANDSLYVDLLDNAARDKLFCIVLLELEILILDIVELDLSLKNIKILNYKILYDLIQKSLQHFLSKLDEVKYIILENKESNYLQFVLSEHQLLLEYLLVYLIFGSSYIDYNVFAFDNINTPKEHVSILLENLIIQISDLVIFTIFENIKSLSEITSFIKNNQLCNTSYVSIRSIAFFRNNLIIQNLKHLYFSQPKAIYSSRYKVWLISSNGIVTKYISISRLDDLSKLSPIQTFFIFFIEIQDIIIPHLENFLLILSKVILYILINFLGNSVVFFIRAILACVYHFRK